jgi:GntR family transcriptional regulator
MADPGALAIDRKSPMPFYFQLAELLEQEITSGRWRAGTRLPAEPELCEQYSLSRTTIRQALARLEQRGLIERRKGQGTFVQRSDPGLWLLQSSEGFFQYEVDRAGRTVTSRILRTERGPLPAWACDALKLPPGAEGATLERLRSLDGAVALCVINHVPERLADAALAITNADESLYRRLRERAGVVPHGGRRTLEAIAAEERVAALLELVPGAPVAFIESVGWEADMRPFDCYRAWLRTDRTRIEIQVSGPGAAEGLSFSLDKDERA